MAQRLARVLGGVVGDSQIGFQLFRHVGENIRLMSEILRYCEHDAPSEGEAPHVVQLRRQGRHTVEIPLELRANGAKGEREPEGAGRRRGAGGEAGVPARGGPQTSGTVF